jgi:N-alpha-acetyltransferase 10/11
VTSLAVLRSHRKLGLATKLMTLSRERPSAFVARVRSLLTRKFPSPERTMVELYNAKYVSLHVRETNYAAFHLYRDTLKFEVHGTEQKYYADGENAFDMRKYITREMLGLPPRGGEASAAAAATAPAVESNGKRGRAEPATTEGGKKVDDAGAEDTGAEDDGEAAKLEPGLREMELAVSAMNLTLD